MTDSKFNSVAFNGLLPRDIECSVREDIQNIFNSNEIEAQIVDLAIVGSRCRGLENDNSDLDIAVEFAGDIKEDALFNIIHEEIITIGSVNVDINPIRAEETGTLEEYLIIAEQSIEKNYNEKQERKITMERKNVTAEIGKKYVHKNGSEFMCIGFDKDTKNPVMQNTETLWTCSVSGLGQYDNETIDWDFSTHGRFEEQLGSADVIVAKKDFVPVYKGDLEIIENRELYIANVAENRRFAEMANKVIGNGLKPRDSVKSLTEQFGIERTAWLTALNIVAHPLDDRFYKADKEWACKVLAPHFEVKPDEMFMNDEEKKPTFDKLINGGTLYSIHNTHLAQFAEALMPEYEKYLSAAATDDNLSDDEPLDLTEQNNTRR